MKQAVAGSGDPGRLVQPVAWDVALQLAVFREKPGLSQEELARKINLPSNKSAAWSCPATKIIRLACSAGLLLIGVMDECSVGGHFSSRESLRRLTGCQIAASKANPAILALKLAQPNARCR